MSKKVLVTGATGFTGSHLCKRLVNKGYNVRALARKTSELTELQKLDLEITYGDVTDPKSLARALKGTEIVYHLAAAFLHDGLPEKTFWEVNVEGTKNLLQTAQQEGVQCFVHCSTVGVHGDIKNPPANEMTPYRPGDYYQESKTEGERVVLKYMAAGHLPIVVFRPAGIYGPRDLRLLKLFKTIKTRTFVMLGSGEVIYQMIYIDDLVDGIVLCGTEEQALGHVYILTGEEPTTLNQLARVIAEVLHVRPTRLRFPVTPVYLAGFACELLCKPLGINPPLYRRRVDFFRKTRCFDISKAKRQLGFKPKTDLRTGIRLTAEWYQKEGWL